MNASRNMSRHVAGRQGRPFELLCLALLVGTLVTGAILHGQTPHGELIQGTATPASGGPGAVEIAHVVCAGALIISLLRHVFDRRRSIISSARRMALRRMTCRSLRSLLAWSALLALVGASFFTGLGPNGPGHVEHHSALSLGLTGALLVHVLRRRRRIVHGVRRMSTGAAAARR